MKWSNFKWSEATLNEVKQLKWYEAIVIEVKQLKWYEAIVIEVKQFELKWSKLNLIKSFIKFYGTGKILQSWVSTQHSP